MDVNQPLDHGTVDNLQLDSASVEFLRETAKWAKFLAIVGFVMIGLMVILSFFMGSFLSSMPGADLSPIPSAFYTVMYLIIAAIYVMPVLYLYRFATNMQAALKSQDQQSLQISLSNLKSHYKFIGILMLIVIGLYAIGFLFALVGGAAATFM